MRMVMNWVMGELGDGDGAGEAQAVKRGDRKLHTF